jgi:hypothetical protein
VPITRRVARRPVAATIEEAAIRDRIATAGINVSLFDRDVNPGHAYIN